MFNFRLASKSFALLACTALLLSTIGCNTGSVISPDLGSEKIIYDDPSFIRILSAPKGFSSPNMTLSVTKVITAEYGGRVSNGFVTLDFPPNALTEDTEITINMQDPNELVVELGPHGVSFNKPVILIFDLSATSEAQNASRTLTVWYNEKEGWWEKLESLPSSDPNQAKTLLEHFSRYGQVPQG